MSVPVLEKSLRKFLTLNVLASKVCFKAFWFSKSEYKSELSEVIADLNKIFFVLCSK